MHIQINEHLRLCDIQQTFSDHFPFLKIKFFRKAHVKYESSDEYDQIDPDKTIGETLGKEVSGILEIQPRFKVCDLEREMQDRFGLPVQIFRKEKDAWEQTTGMDDFTLKDLNIMGRNSSDDYIVAEEGEEEEI